VKEGEDNTWEEKPHNPPRKRMRRILLGKKGSSKGGGSRISCGTNPPKGRDLFAYEKKGL